MYHPIIYGLLWLYLDVPSNSHVLTVQLFELAALESMILIGISIIWSVDNRNAHIECRRHYSKGLYSGWHKREKQAFELFLLYVAAPLCHPALEPVNCGQKSNLELK